MQYSYLSKTSGIGGKIKSVPEDFIVEEIGTDGTIYELGKKFSKSNTRNPDGGRYVYFILQKKKSRTAKQSGLLFSPY